MRQRIQVERHLLNKKQECQKRGEFCDYYSYLDKIDVLNRILELVIFSKKCEIGDYELKYLPSDILSHVRQELLLQKQAPAFRFRPDIDDICELYPMLLGSLLVLRIDNSSLDNKKLKTKSYILNTIGRQVQDFGSGSKRNMCRDCMMIEEQSASR